MGAKITLSTNAQKEEFRHPESTELPIRNQYNKLTLVCKEKNILKVIILYFPFNINEKTIK